MKERKKEESPTLKPNIRRPETLEIYVYIIFEINISHSPVGCPIEPKYLFSSNQMPNSY